MSLRPSPLPCYSPKFNLQKELLVGKHKVDSSSTNQDSSKEREILIKEVAKSTVSIPNMSDDEPLSIWIQALKKAHATSASHGGNAEVKCNTNCSQHNCIPSCQCIDPILPFEKTRSLWKTIESMEVFRQMPQTPHFKSLSMIKEISREGRAVALMVWFSDVVEKIPTLQPDVPRNIMEDVVETLDELEDNGFDVFVIRDRLMQLLSSKDKRDELESKEKEHTQQICLLREECGLPLSTRAEIDSKIADLESIVSGINESISYIDLEFKALAAAPWPLR